MASKPSGPSAWTAERQAGAGITGLFNLYLSCTGGHVQGQQATRLRVSHTVSGC